MRLLPGQPQDISGESITSYSLVNAAIKNADVLTRVWQAFKQEEYSPLSAILASKGYMTKGLRDGVFNQKYRVVKSNHVIYPIASSKIRKPKFAPNSTGLTYVSYAYSTTPGYGGTPFYIFLDSNWVRPNEVIELNDNKTHLFVYDDQEPVEIDGVWRYEVKLETGTLTDSVDTDLMAEGNETAVMYVIYEQDFSETGSEKYTYDGWGHSYMTLQRVKMSYSGTAKAMMEANDPNTLWYAFKNKEGQTRYTYLDHANAEMMRRAARYHENQIIFGKTTVDADGKVFLHNKKNREMMAGNGLLFGNDGAIDRPMTSQGWTMRYLESLLKDVDLRSGRDGQKELLLVGGWENILSFQRMMKDSGYVTQDNNLVGDGAEKGAIDDYKFYQLMNIKIYPMHYRYFSSAERANKPLSNGDSKVGWDALVIPLGTTELGDNNVELVQLRPPVTGTVHGMDKGGDDMASSVDGAHKHFLWQTGIISRIDIFKLFMPWST